MIKFIIECFEYVGYIYIYDNNWLMDLFLKNNVR